MQMDRWSITGTCPDDWPSLIERCGGGVFHSPAGLWSGTPDGVPFYARFLHGGETAGIAFGLQRRCSLSARARHVYLPTLPAFRADVASDAALVALARTLAEQGSAEIVVDSYDARWSPEEIGGAVLGRPRQEYIVHLDAGCTADTLARRCAAAQRRYLRRGERDGWVVRALVGEDARRAIAEVQHAAARRAIDRGNGFAPHTPGPRDELSRAELGAPWGTRTFAAFQDETLLAAALVGWAGGRAFYGIGGSTPAGYDASAASWLHWRIMTVLAAHGYSAYNLGGTPASAIQPDDPAHGLFRFKVGLGADVVACRGVRWVFAPTHMRAHMVARRLIAPFHAWTDHAT